MVHCSQRGSEVIIGHMAHGFAYEQGIYNEWKFMERIFDLINYS